MNEPLLSDDLLLRTLRELIEADSSIHQVAKRVDVDHRHLARMLDGKQRMPFDFFLLLCETLGAPSSLVHLAARPQGLLTLDEAEAALRLCREPKPRSRDPIAPPPSPLLAELAARLPAWLDAAQDIEGESARVEMLALEEERFADPAGVRTKVETRIRALLEGPPTRAARADLSLALAIWSTLRRLAGHRSDARDGCIYAVQCLNTSHCPFCVGFILLKAIYILVEFEKFRFCFIFLDLAANSFVASDEPIWQARVLLHRGLCAWWIGACDESEAFLRLSLSRFPESAQRERATAFETLARVYRKTARLASAQEALREAMQCCPAQSLDWAFLSWRQAEILQEQRRFIEARILLEEALPIMVLKGEPMDATLMAIELAKSAILSGRIDLLPEIAESILTWVQRLAPYRKAHRAALQLVNVIISRRADIPVLQDTHRRIVDSIRTTRRRKKKVI